MRISDWSSDVCSSDLSRARRRSAQAVNAGRSGIEPKARPKSTWLPTYTSAALKRSPSSHGEADFAAISSVRSEEHTSELQSLMRISYAVFCLKKKNRKTQTL